jgi:hypothetical protein
MKKTELDKEREEEELDEDDALARQAVDYGISGSILGIMVLTAIYAFFPIDALPSLSQSADEMSVIAAGAGAVFFLAIMRFVLVAMMTNRIWRWGCVMLVMLASTGAFAVFWILAHLFSSVFGAILLF